MNAATKTTGWNNGQTPHANGNGGVRTSQSLDYNVGAGALNLDRTFDQYLLGETDISGTTGGTTLNELGWDMGTVTVGRNVDILIDVDLLGGTDFTTTLTWFRDRTYNGVGNFTDNAFANLDLEFWDSTFTSLISESDSLYNSVEHLSFALPTTGKYGLRVAHSGNLFGAVNSVDFALAWAGTAVPEPTALSLLLLGIVPATLHRKRQS